MSHEDTIPRSMGDEFGEQVVGAEANAVAVHVENMSSHPVKTRLMRELSGFGYSFEDDGSDADTTMIEYFSADNDGSEHDPGGEFDPDALGRELTISVSHDDAGVLVESADSVLLHETYGSLSDIPYDKVVNTAIQHLQSIGAPKLWAEGAPGWDEPK